MDKENNKEDFVISNGILTKYTGSDDYVLVPDGIERIEAHAFEGNTKIKSVVLPHGLKSIGSYAFAMCNSLKKVEIPDTVICIEADAFGKRNNLYRKYNNGYYIGNKNNPYFAFVKVLSSIFRKFTSERMKECAGKPARGLPSPA